MYSLRPPQVDVLNQIRVNAKNGHKRILLMAATGMGKTILAYDICRTALAKGKRVLFTAHRIQLAEQTLIKFASLKPSFLQGDSDGYDHDNLLQVATLQTLANRIIETPDIILIDEVHYAYTSNLVQSLFEKFPNALVIGLSASPVDDQGFLLEGFDSIIDTYQTEDLIKLKWLVPFMCYSPVQLDLSQVKIEKGDYNQEQLENVVNKGDINKSAVENYLKYGEGKTFLCYAVSKIHAKQLHDCFNSMGVKVDMVTADTPTDQREQSLKDIETGAIRGIVNIDIMVAGTDIPSLGCLVLASPTKSWKKYIQMCGRVIRLHGDSFEESVLNGKSYGILLDCAGAIAEHGLPDTRRVFKFKPKIGRVVDKHFKLDESTEERAERIKTISVEKQVFLKKIGSLLDLYDGKVYAKEADLMDDCKNFIEKTGFFYFRQNSGKMFKDNRWVHFTSKSGLPDYTVYYKDTSFYFGMELKLPKGTLTTHQKETLPEMTDNKLLYFIIESVFDVFKAIEHIESNIVHTDDATIISKGIYQLPQRQIDLRQRLKLGLYA